MKRKSAPVEPYAPWSTDAERQAARDELLGAGFDIVRVDNIAFFRADLRFQGMSLFEGPDMLDERMSVWSDCIVALHRKWIDADKPELSYLLAEKGLALVVMPGPGKEYGAGSSG